MRKSKSTLFVCNTYMQLLLAIQIKRKLLPEEPADLILSDLSNGWQSVTERLKKEHLFRCTKGVQIKYMAAQSRMTDMRDVLDMMLGHSKKYQELLIDKTGYDRIFYYNPDVTVLGMYQQSIKQGHEPELIQFEEGLFCYPHLATTGDMGGRMKLISILQKTMHKSTFLDQTKSVYCMYPKLLPANDKCCCAVPTLSRQDTELVEMLNRIFDYDPKSDIYPQKYIFFGTNWEADGHPIGETEIVLQLAERVGAENLLVKMHPRDGRHLYEEHGITVSRNSAIPWEVIQLNHDFGDRVFVTVSSSSAMQASAMLGDDVPTYFLFPMVWGRNKKLDAYGENNIASLLNGLQNQGKMPGIKICASLSEIDL